MAFDPATILTLTIAIAAAAAFYLIMEWRGARHVSLLLWATGFGSITLGCTLALLRTNGHFLIGVWFANGLLVLAHWLFLLGVARFVGARLSRRWWLIVPLWCALLWLPEGPDSSKLYLITNSLLVAGLALRASLALRLQREAATLGTRQLHYTLLVHGLFYAGKAALAIVPGTLIDLTVFGGAIIRISLVEGVMAILLIALSMTGTVRYQRERQIESLAERDPLTSLYNRRAFEARAAHQLRMAAVNRPGALLLIDIDHFKPVNDLHGHAAGDRLLVLLSEQIQETLPDTALSARLGGDEFAILLADVRPARLVALADDFRQQFRETAARHFITPSAVTLSIGAVVFHVPPGDLATLLVQGDNALYEAKRAGRNGIRIIGETSVSAGPSRAANVDMIDDVAS